jgi:TusA-related sulfurtransferase
MRTIDTRGEKPYSPLIPAVEAIARASRGEQLEIIMTDAVAFGDLKEYLSELHIGFREVYDGEVMTLQFTR